MKEFTLKVLLLLSIQSVFTTIVFANKEKSVKFIFEQYTVENGRGITSYLVYSENQGNHDLSFLALPAEDTNGDFSVYAIRINNIELKEKIAFTRSGWQEAQTRNRAITLRKGENRLSFISNGRDIPQIRNIDLYRGKQRFAPEGGGNPHQVLTTFSGTATEELSPLPKGSVYYNEPLFRPGATLKQPYGYTFFLPLYYQAGERASFYAPTSNDPRFGPYESTIEFNAYFFHENPEIFSISNSSYNKYLFWQIDIPQTGIYYILVEAKQEGEQGGVTLYVNNNMLYRYSLVQNRSFLVSKEEPRHNIFVTARDSCYNIFTVNGISIDKNLSADPYLWLKRYDDTGKATIVAYNDNNQVPSDFAWGNNARIRTHLDDDTSYRVLLSSTHPTYAGNDTCDLYHSFWNNPDTISLTTLELKLPNLKYEDAIESGKGSMEYNCIAWSAGINYGGVLWPDNESLKDITWYDRLYNNDTVRTSSGKFVRPSFFPRYTREGATEENSVVDLWGEVREKDTLYTHASIRNPFDGIPHGYDWESKLGWGLIRIFHPRYALSGKDSIISYGKVVAHYRIADNQTIRNNNAEVMTARAIAEGNLMIENISLTAEEENRLVRQINELPLHAQTRFESLYNRWIQYTDRHRLESNLEKLKECEEYAQLARFSASSPGYACLTYDKFIKGDFRASILIKDLVTREGNNLRIRWKRIMESSPEKNVVRTPRAYITLFIKSVLQKTETPLIDNVIRSNSDKFEVALTPPNRLIVDINLPQAARYSLRIINLETNGIYELAREQKREKGRYTHSGEVPSGLYLVTYIYNGNINSKKIVAR